MTDKIKALQDALDDFNRWQPDFDEDGDMCISSQELFGCYMSEHHETIRQALTEAIERQKNVE